jgi:hypothetical protein
MCRLLNFIHLSNGAVDSVYVVLGTAAALVDKNQLFGISRRSIKGRKFFGTKVPVFPLSI